MLNVHKIGLTIQTISAQCMVMVTMLFYGMSAKATINMPVPQNPSGSSTIQGNWFSQLMGWIIEGKDIALALLITAVIGGYAWGVFMEVMKIRREREADWGRVGIFVIAGVALILFVGYLTNEADGILVNQTPSV